MIADTVPVRSLTCPARKRGPDACLIGSDADDLIQVAGAVTGGGWRAGQVNVQQVNRPGEQCCSMPESVHHGAVPLFRGKDQSRPDSTDPRGRRREADEAIGAALGLPLRGVTPITDILRGVVSDDVCRALPGVEHSSAARSMLLVCAASSQMPIATAQALRPDLTYGHAAAAALPGMMLLAVTTELVRRYDVTHPDVPYERHRDTAPATPPPALRVAYEVLRRECDGAPMPARHAGAAMARAVSAGDHDTASRSWTGWAMVASVSAMAAHQHLLPEPGRARDRPPEKRAGADAAGFAYQLGRATLAAAAIALVSAATETP